MHEPAGHEQCRLSLSLALAFLILMSCWASSRFATDYEESTIAPPSVQISVMSSANGLCCCA